VTNFRIAKYTAEGICIDDPNQLDQLSTSEIETLREIAQGGGTDIVPQTVSYVKTGLGVAWLQDFDFRCSAGTYTIQGLPYSVAETLLSLAASDATHDRIDVFIVDTAGVWSIIQGTPATPPVKPDVNPETQLEVTFAIVPATATEPSFASDVVDIYKENAEWTAAASAGAINVASPVGPQTGTYCIEASNAGTGVYVQFTTSPALTLTTFNSIVLNIRNKAAWASGRLLSLQWYEGSTPKGNRLSMRNGSWGFSSSLTGAYQQIVVPISEFGIIGIPVDRLRIAVAGNGGGLSWFMDNISLQPGLVAPVVGGMTWEGAWDSSKLYRTNNVVTSGGGTYVALRGNIAALPTTATEDWEEMVTPAGSGSVESVTGNLVDNTDPANPVVGGVESVTGDGVDNTDPANPVITAVASVSAGANVTVDNTDPANPIVSATGGGSTQGKHMIPIMAGAMVPSMTNGCSVLTLANPSGAGYAEITYLRFDPTTAAYATFALAMPESWNAGTLTFRAIWLHPAGSGAVVWTLQAVGFGSGDDFASTTLGTAVTATQTGGSTERQYITSESSAMTIAGSPAKGDTVYFRLGRLPTDGSDTLNVDAYLLGIRLYYTTDADTDA